MGARALKRIEVLDGVRAGRRTVASAAVVLAINAMEVNRLLIRDGDGGGGAPSTRAVVGLQATSDVRCRRLHELTPALPYAAVLLY